MPADIQPGFITLHGNQLEELRQAVLDWTRAYPLAPLEEEVFLVQSNGVAEWLKIAMAEDIGVCAATQITLPGRFLWQSYRSMLGRDVIATRSALDKAPLTWLLMRLLPTVLDLPGFAPLRTFLAGGDAERRLQLAQRLADLYDQYQVYRADWLNDWSAGRDVLRTGRGDAVALAADQRWQALLWRLAVASVPVADQSGGRAGVHARFVAALQSGAIPAGRLPRRVIVFGIAALPYQTLQALAALATRTQVMVAIPNPCQFFWGDIISGRELLTARHRRQPLRGGRDLGDMPLEDLHAHSNPLLATWGRLGRDFVRLLDEFDDVDATRAGFATLRIDLFSDGPGATLLQQVQAAVRDNLPLAEHPGIMPAAGDHSIEFHATHGVQREVEVLHDRLLTLLAQPAASGSPALRPRDIIVMVPDIAVFTPAIEAVFGQYGDHDRRHIPFAIADTTQRKRNPLLVAVEWLLRLPDQRCLQSEIRDLLDVPAVAARLGLTQGDLPRLAEWIAGAGVRWGLDGGHRAGLGLAAAGEQNGWLFGLRRMLLGYASGEDGTYGGIEPFADVGGLDAGIAGALGSLVQNLLHWCAVLGHDATPQTWAGHARALLHDFFLADAEEDRLTMTRLEQELACWLENCEGARFDAPVPLAVMREAWLSGFDDADLHQRFVSGGVTFCTLMPMRAVPYRMVCLLGMNDGDFPRRIPRADFDLLGLPGMARPGDRSRRDDDRYLMLEACLSARDKLYVGWTGHNMRDNATQPPSVLVAQLRDYLHAGWQIDPAALTVDHPLQPFSRRYFEGGALVTYAREWRVAHDGAAADVLAAIPPLARDAGRHITMADLGHFLRQPATYFFRHRLQVVFPRTTAGDQDEEPFAIGKLEEYALVGLLHDDRGAPEAIDDVDTALAARAARFARQGVLPFGLIGASWQEELVAQVAPARRAWLTLCARFPEPAAKLPVRVARDASIALDDWIDGLRSDGHQAVWMAINPGLVLMKPAGSPRPRIDKIIDAWIRQLASAAAGHPVTGFLVGREAILRFDPIDQADATAALHLLMGCWQDGMDRPLPTACKTAIAMLTTGDEQKVYDGGFNAAPPGEVKGDAVLARLWPDFEALSRVAEWASVSRTLYGPLTQWAASSVHVVSFDALMVKEAA